MRCYIPKRYIAAIMASIFVFAANMPLKTVTASFKSGRVINMRVYDKNMKTGPKCVNRNPEKGNVTTTRRPENPHLYNWDKHILTKIRLAIWIPRVTTPFLGGYLADKHGSRYVTLVLGLTMMVLTYTGSAVLLNCRGYWQILIVYNILRGGTRGAFNPSLIAFLGQWIPPKERTFIISLFISCHFLGELTDFKVATEIIQATNHLPAMNYICGSCQLICCVLWFFFCYSNPELHPTISKKEKRLLRESLGPCFIYKAKSVPWKDIFCSLTIWGMLLSYFGVSVAVLQTYWKLLDYTRLGLGYNLESSHFGIITCIMISLNIILGLLTDHFTKRKKILHTATARKISSNFGAMGAGILCLTIAYTNCIENLVAALATIAMSVAVIYCTAVVANALDLAANFAGVLVGIGLTFYHGIRTGFLMWMPGVTDNNEQYEWRLAFWTTLGVCTLSNIIFALSCKGTMRKFNRPVIYKKEDYDEYEEIELK